MEHIYKYLEVDEEVGAIFNYADGYGWDVELFDVRAVVAFLSSFNNQILIFITIVFIIFISNTNIGCYRGDGRTEYIIIFKSWL